MFFSLVEAPMDYLYNAAHLIFKFEQFHAIDVVIAYSVRMGINPALWFGYSVRQ